MASDPRRRLPSVDAVLRSPGGRRAIDALGRPLVTRSVRDAVAVAREAGAREILSAADPAAALLERALAAAAPAIEGMDRVVNATGVLLHTGLGRAPLARQAAAAASRVAAGYTDLEVDRASGRRGKRTSRAETLLGALTGAEAALAVNNNAAALLLTLAALANRREVVVSRGELIEIGGEFRLPEILAASGARLVEVGTTNRTRPADYRRALGPRTALILKVHPSNYRVVGFTNQVPLAALVDLAGDAGVALAHDVGSGLLEPHPAIPPDEPAVSASLAAGAGLVCFSGDKLFGGPQAGMVVGRRDLVDRLRRHPMARAMRLDKMTIAALEATLRLYATGRRREIPLWAFVETPRRALLARARSIAATLPGASARPSEAVAGGGSLPGHPFPSAEVVIPCEAPERVAARLRLGRPPVFCRTGEGAVALDLRAVPPDDDARLARAVRRALAPSTVPAPA